jgi:AcrR family transcriptional regulator
MGAAIVQVVTDPDATSRPRRADAERNVAAILDAATDALADRPDASVGSIAKAAGVTRQTVYAHYPSREALVGAVADRALAQAVAAIEGARPDEGPPAEALGRLIPAWWETVGEHARVLEALAGAGEALADVHAFHAPILERLVPLIRRGQRSGDFEPGVPAEWHAVAFLALVHAAADQVARGTFTEEQAGEALASTVPRALASE